MNEKNKNETISHEIRENQQQKLRDKELNKAILSDTLASVIELGMFGLFAYCACKFWNHDIGFKFKNELVCGFLETPKPNPYIPQKTTAEQLGIEKPDLTEFYNKCKEEYVKMVVPTRKCGLPLANNPAECKMALNMFATEEAEQVCGNVFNSMKDSFKKQWNSLETKLVNARDKAYVTCSRNQNQFIYDNNKLINEGRQGYMRAALVSAFVSVVALIFAFSSIIDLKNEVIAKVENNKKKKKQQEFAKSLCDSNNEITKEFSTTRDTIITQN